MSRPLVRLRNFAPAFAAVALLHAPSALALANRVFASARTGSNANSCDNINTPCQTLQAAISQLNPDGDAVVLDSGGYGPLVISQPVTVEAAPGVTAFIHPPSGDAITICATGTVTLRGLTLSVGGNGIKVNCVGTLNVENVSISGFSNAGIFMLSGGGRLNVKGTDITSSGIAVLVSISSGTAQTSIDHCHLDGNGVGFLAQAGTAAGSSTTEATYTTANNNTDDGWVCGNGSAGKDVLNLEFCTGSENAFDGLTGDSTNAQSAARYSNCVFANNGQFGVDRKNAGIFATRGNNTIIGNVTAPTSGTIGSFSPM
jgi:hypothetical protein